MKYTRIFCDSKGESHFEDVTVKVSPTDFAPPAPPLNLALPQEVERSVLCEFPVGWFGDWHPAPRRQFYFQMSGELEVEVSDGDRRRFHPGSVVLVEDISGKGHKTRVVSSTEVNAVFIQFPTVSSEKA